MAGPPSSPVYIDLRAILSESDRIINAHFRHFLALSVLFLLPISISSANPAIYKLYCQSSIPTIEINLNFLNNPLQQQQLPFFTIKTLIFSLVYNIFISIFTLLATASITYSVSHGFYGRPVKLASAIKSAFTSFFRLVSTFLISELIVYGILFIFALVCFLLIMATLLLGFQFNSSSPFLYLVSIIIFVATAAYHLQVIWTFAYVIVVVESSWGFEPLKRSQNLVKGLKRVAFSILMYFWFMGWIFLRGSAAAWSDSAADKWKNWTFVLMVVASSTFIMLLKLYILVATTVFYMYSKAMHGELAAKITEEFAKEYVSLPIDDAEVPNVVSVPSLKTSV